MRTLGLEEIKAVSGGMDPVDGIQSVGIVVGAAALVGAATPIVIGVGMIAIGAMAVIDMATGGREKESS